MATQDDEHPYFVLNLALVEAGRDMEMTIGAEVNHMDVASSYAVGLVESPQKINGLITHPGD